HLVATASPGPAARTRSRVRTASQPTTLNLASTSSTTLDDDDTQSELSSLTTLTPSEPHSDPPVVDDELEDDAASQDAPADEDSVAEALAVSESPAASEEPQLEAEPEPVPAPPVGDPFEPAALRLAEESDSDDDGYQPSTSLNRYTLAEELTPEQLEEMEGGGQQDQPGPDPQQFDQLMQQFFMNMMQRVQQQPMPQGGGHAAPHQPRVPLPYPDEKGAPRFDSDEYKIGMFLDSFETRARLAGVAEEQWKKKVVDYVDRDTRNQWMQVDEFADNATWAEFRASVLKLYPENGTIKVYTLEELKERIAKWKEAGVFKSQDAVSRYTREFLACQKSLQRQG
ncbi:hypothetical protein AURDEDRAFT_174802, partial [Auricularia subglabra TFB-10046 SS5]